MGQLPGAGVGFVVLSQARTSANAFEQTLQVFFLPALEEEKNGNSSISKHLLHDLHSLVNVFPGLSNLWLCCHWDSELVELSCFDDAEFKQSFDCINSIRLN